MRPAHCRKTGAENHKRDPARDAGKKEEHQLKKSLLGILVAAFATVLFVVSYGGAKEVKAEGEHVGGDHCVCGYLQGSSNGYYEGTGHTTHTAITTWTAWGDDAAEQSSLPTTTGNYYLTQDISWSSDAGLTKITTENVQIVICLNGHSVTWTNTASSVKFLYNLGDVDSDVTKNITLTITDCSKDANGDAEGSISMTGKGRLVRMDAASTLNLFRGVINLNVSGSSGGCAYLEDSGTINVYDMVINGPATTTGASGGIFWVGAASTSVSSTLNMYGGILAGGHATDGGNVNVASNGTFNMFGGLITSGNASGGGGNVYVVAGGTFNMSGGVITNGVSVSNGNQIACHGTVNFSGTCVVGSAGSGSKGNPVNVGSASTVITVTGGYISYIQAVSASGHLNVNGGILGSMSNYNCANVVINGGIIRGTFSQNSSGQNPTTTINGGYFGDTVTANAGKLYINGGHYTSVPTGTGTLTYGTDLETVAIPYQVMTTTPGGDTLTRNGVNYVSYKAPAGTAKLTNYYVRPVHTETHVHAESVNAESSAYPAAAAVSQTWTAVRGNNLPTTTGYYYLDEDVAYNTGFALEPGADVHLCLNGHKLLRNTSGRVIQSYYSSTTAEESANTKLSICDCSAGMTGEVRGFGSDSNQGKAVWMPYGTLNLFSGSLVGAESTQYSGGTIALSGTMNMYGGVVTGGSVVQTTMGGNIFVAEGATLNLYGGTIRDGQVRANAASPSGAGGNVGANGTINMYGGTICDGQSRYGGNVYLGATGVLNMSGGTITGGSGRYTVDGTNYTTGTGSNIYTAVAITNGHKASITLSGTAVIGPVSTLTKTHNISISLQSATFTMGDDVVVNGSFQAAGSGAEATVNGGSVQACSIHNGTITINDGTVKGDIGPYAFLNGNPNGTSTGHLTINGGYINNVLTPTTAANKANLRTTVIFNGGYYVNRPDSDYFPDDTYYVFTDRPVTVGNVTYPYEVSQGYIIDTDSRTAAGSMAAAAPVAGGGLIRSGEEITLTATTPYSGYEFVEWQNDLGTQVSTDAAYTFTPAEDAAYTAIYTFGYATYALTVDAGSYTLDPTGGSYAAGTEVTVTFTGTGFAGWYNSMGKIVSKDPAYTFTINADTTLSAKTAASSALVVFYTKNSYVNKTMSLEDLLTENALPPVPTEHGMGAGQWSKTLAEIETEGATADIVEVMATYPTTNGQTYTVTVVNKEGSNTETKAATAAVNIAAATTVTADATFNGEAFSFFAADAAGTTILSYNREITVRFETNTTIYAFYGVSATSEPVTVTMVSNSVNGSTLFFEALRSAEDGVEILEQGILFTHAGKMNGKTAAEALIYNGTDCFQFKSSGIQANDTTGLALKNIPAGTTFYARGYVVYKKNGSSGIVYSDIASATAE